ncbi:MAG: beta-hexosaminidase, partial [Tannerellaceae bacterium]
HRPAKIVVSVSNDNENYAVVATDGAGDNTTQEEGIAIKDHEFKNLNKQARYVKFNLSTPGVCYPKHVRAGQKTWMHCDEVIIE